MEKIKKIIKAIFILTVIISSANVYGTRLLYEATVKELGSDKQECYITTMVTPYDATIEDYDKRVARGEADSTGWLTSDSGDRSTTGGAYTYASFYYAFHKDKNPLTNYVAGFDTDTSNTTNNNIYYDKFVKANGSNRAIDEYFDGIDSLQGVAVNIPENQGTDADNLFKLYKGEDGFVESLRWKVVKKGGSNVVLNVFKINSDGVDALKKKYTPEALFEGIMFSNGLRTKFSQISSNQKSNMDTAWLFYQLTIDGLGVDWSSSGRGFVNPYRRYAYQTSEYAPGTTHVNQYDNFIKIPFELKKAKTEVYVNHVDEQGNKIPGFQNPSLNIVDKNNNVIGTRTNAGPKGIYEEYYTIQGDEGIAVRKSSLTSIGTTKYTFQYGKSATADFFGTASNLLPNSTYTWSSPHVFRTNQDTTKVDNVVVVNLVYKKIPPPVQELPNLEMIGRLAFINTSSEYIGSTSGHALDYIPSTKQLTPYAQGAYPYVVRALRYEPRNETNSSSATVTTYITYKWDIWTYSHDNSAASRKLTCTIAEHSHSSGCYSALGALTCGKTAHTHTGIYGSCYSHQHTSACDWYKTTNQATTNKVFNYTVSYKHTWFQITNFKMYRISKVVVFDNEDNIGGKLFTNGVEEYTINPSGTYESRFNNSRGKINKTLTVSFPSKSYYLDPVYVEMAKPSGGTGTASGTSENSNAAALSTANTKLGEVNHKIAADHEDLTITYQYDNDYVELDGMTNMLQRNYKTWSEHIIKETDTYNRDLDSTRTGTGQVNGSALSYTSNLMSFMRPSIRLTTNDDFTPNYQTVPANRENGIRELKGRIYYNITSDPKYNVGSNTFTSKDATYQLNKDINLTNLDFADYDKLYENNGAVNDVNKVNVLTPINFGNFDLITDQKVDHSTGAGNATILQKNAVFTITPSISGSSTAGYSLGNTREFVKGYYFIFDFNIIYNGNTLLAYNPIYIPGSSASITAKTTDSFGSGSAEQLTNSIKIVAITTNITDLLKEYFDNARYTNYNYMDNENNIVRNTNVQNQRNFLRRSDIVSDSYHAIYKRITTRNLGRIFDFAVSDCTDLAFKDIFKTTTAGNINTPTGKSYYSGYKKWNLYSSAYNEMVDRTDIGGTPQTILPLGPYKNTNTKYVNAPKMGYRISFDLKTTGYMAANNFNDSRKIEITPKYYYISKDGKTFDNNIKLYFKNANGNYVNFASSGYTIYYKPNDGYRYLRNSMYTDNFTMMSTKLEPLTISDKIVLTSKSMSTNNTSFIQAWYGEFKLPNSTIAVSNIVGSPNSNINNPYKDGYIGVIFDIKCKDTGGFTLSYDTNDKSASSQTNTSQWDYEGFMNFKTPGSATNTLRYQLEKDIWLIDNARYQQVKGTVVLFDIDNRAANDFE